MRMKNGKFSPEKLGHFEESANPRIWTPVGKIKEIERSSISVSQQVFKAPSGERVIVPQRLRVVGSKQ